MTLRKINKRIARRMFDENKPFVIVGDNVNEFHILSGWHLGCTIDPSRYKEHSDNVWSTGSAFDDMVADFEFYLERELGRRSAFYVNE